MLLRAGDIIKHKGGNVVTIEATATVLEAIARMVDHNVGSILVMDQDTLAGVFTERDYLRRIILQGRTSKETRIADAMTAEVVTVDSGVSVQDCMAIMTQKKCRHLPVVDEGTVVGVVSIGDCVKEISKVAQAHIKDLTAYISGTYPA